MTNHDYSRASPTTTIPQWSIDKKRSLSDHLTSDDQEFLDRLLFLKPENKSTPNLNLERAHSFRSSVIDLDSEGDQSDDDVAYDHTQYLTQLLAKPRLLPSNALCLHLADPNAPLTTPHDPSHPPSDAPIQKPLRPGGRIRFRSRVRITSGLNHFRSGSPSSSISAPLRYHSDEESNSTWGTLGQRVGMLASQKRTSGSRRNRRKGVVQTPHGNDEHTPLRGSFSSPYYVTGEGVQDGDINEDEDEDDKLAQEIDAIFGTFPGRLLNYQWWWWQLEPIVCCQCTDDFE